MNVAMYLRKSRTDEELEKTLGEGETLLKHRKALLKFAKERNLTILDIKEELVSGDSLFFRPKMLELLSEVESNKYDGVLVMDIDRLGRGGMKDQGIILEAFKDSNTKIITPMKTYDLDNEMDEEMTEFKAFFARRELKTITRRMQGGRVRSVEEGNYIATNAPLGYDIAFIGRNRTLKINERESDIVKLIFKMYSDGNGAGTIAKHLKKLGYKSKLNNDFSDSSLLFILKNPIYIGKVAWKKKEIKKSMDPNKKTDTQTRDISDWIIANGKHDSIIDIATYNRVQDILKGKYHIPYKQSNGAANPLAGIMICSFCNSKMVLRKYGDKAPHIICSKKCGNKSSRFDFIENELLTYLAKYLDNIKGSIEELESESTIDLYQSQLESLRNKLSSLNSQKIKLFDLLEQGIYDNDTFIERSKNINERTIKLESEIESVKKIIDSSINTKEVYVNNRIENVINLYEDASIIYKNELLKSILEKVEYKKTKEQKGNDFEMTIFLR